MTSSAEDIWSTRLQRELLALTAEGEENKKNVGVLPPFLSLKAHHLEISNGICKVSFGISVDDIIMNKNSNEGASAAMKKEGNELVRGKEGKENKDLDDETKAEEPTKDSSQEGDDENQASEHEAPKEDGIASTQNNNNYTIIITLDASLQYKYGAQIPDASASYPFFKPKAYLSSGASLLPPSIGIQDGAMIQIDCDWTPSLHLNDAALNIALKVRESVRRGEACLRVESQSSFSIFGEENSTKVSNFFTSLKNKASALVDDVDSKLDGAMREKPKILNRRREKQQQQQLMGEESAASKVVTEENVENGDVIDLSQGPWNRAVGMYPCRAIRRPDFVEAAIKAANDKHNSRKVSDDAEDENEIPYGVSNYLQLQAGSVFQVAGSGFTGAGSIFKSFSKSAKSLVEESFLVLTSNLLLEITCSKFSVSTATVTFCIPISQLSKLKFRREESISLFFKAAPDDPIIYMCESSADAVKQIQVVLKQHGVKGKHTNATILKAVQLAVEMMADIKRKEDDLVSDPQPERVTEIMDMYRQAAERFEMADDKRHEEVMSLMREFLAKPLVIGVLDGSIKPKDSESEISQSNLTQSLDKAMDSNLNTSMDNEVKGNEGSKDEELDKAMKAAEEMLNSAHDELKNLGVTDDLEDLEKDDFNITDTEPMTSSSSKDVVSEFEDMLADADKELEELMGS